MAAPNPAPRRFPGSIGGRPSALWYGLVIIMAVGLAQMYYLAPGGRTIPYSQFKQLVQAGSVEEVVVGEQMIRGTLKAPLEGDSSQSRLFMTTRVDDPKLTEELGAKGVKYSGELLNRWLPELLSWIIPLGIIIALWAFFFRRIGGAEGGVMSFARSKAKIYADDEVKVRFSDVAGVDEAEEELKEIVEFLKNPEEVHQPRRPHSQGRAPRRPPRNGKDAACAGGRGRGPCALLQPERVGVRRDVRRRGCGENPRSLPAIGSQGTVHRVHRRAGRPGQGARAEPDWQPRGARADAQPVAGRDGWLRRAQGRDHHGRPPTAPRCSTRPSSARGVSTARSSWTSPM